MRRLHAIFGMLLLPVCLCAQAVTPARAAKHESAGDRIAGTVVSKADGHPLGRARVVITPVNDPQKSQSLITEDNGKFEFVGVPAGKYSLDGAKRGYISAAYDQHEGFSTAVVTGAGLDTEHLVLKLSVDAVIAGKILDEADEPIRNAAVNLYYEHRDEGMEEIHIFRSVQTDDLGNYEMTSLRPGTYFLSASAKPWYAVHPRSQVSSGDQDEGNVDRSLDVAYPLTYYPDVTDTDSATPIPIQGGERIQVDIHMTPVPALRLLFRVPGDQKTGFAFPQLEQPAFDGTVNIPAENSQMISPGLMEITGVAAGRYDIRLQGRYGGAQMNAVDVSRDGEEIDTNKSDALSKVTISVHIAGGGARPKQLGVGLRSGNRSVAGWQMIVDEKSEAEFENIAAGQYDVVAWGEGNLYTIARITAEGAEVAGHSVTITPGTSASLSVSLIAGGAEVQGTVKRAGKPFAGAMVVLVPKNAEGNHDLFRRDQSDLDGTFGLHAVVPGSYTVLAIENGWDLDWSRPEVIGAYLKHGRIIEVRGRSRVLVGEVEVVSK